MLLLFREKKSREERGGKGNERDVYLSSSYFLLLNSCLRVGTAERRRLEGRGRAIRELSWEAAAEIRGCRFFVADIPSSLRRKCFE